MSTNEPTTQEGTASELTDFDGRPSDCACWNTEADLPCFVCYLAGFEEPNPNLDD